jgi:hypothetical protein
MNITLKSFSQDVDLADPSKVNYYLVFEAGNSVLRLPVLKETTEELVKFLYAQGPEKTTALEIDKEAFLREAGVDEDEDEDKEDAEEFGGDYSADEEGNGYDSEEEVPSL